MLATLETDRLILRPLELADAEQVQPLFAQWEVVKFLNHRVPWPFPADGSYRYYRDIALPAMDRGDEWHWTLRLKTDPAAVIGAIGLFRVDLHRGFWLGLPWHGQGLMTEAAFAVTDFWFDVLGFPFLRTAKAIENRDSRRISEKMGMRVVELTEKEYVSGSYPTEVWEITADEWRQRRR